jgi:hypothetical protein
MSAQNTKSRTLLTESPMPHTGTQHLAVIYHHKPSALNLRKTDTPCLSLTRNLSNITHRTRTNRTIHHNLRRLWSTIQRDRSKQRLRPISLQRNDVNSAATRRRDRVVGRKVDLELAAEGAGRDIGEGYGVGAGVRAVGGLVDGVVDGEADGGWVGDLARARGECGRGGGGEG